MSTKPWYARYVGDWRAKTTRLSLAEKGAYSELIDEYYMMAEALPEALDDLCRICGAVSEEERRAVQKVANQYFTLKNNKLHHKRIDSELTRMSKIQQGLSNRGKAGAKARWDGQSNATAIDSAIPASMLGAMAYPQSQSYIKPNTDSVVLNTIPEERENTAPLVENPTLKLNGEHKPQVTKAGMWAIELRKLNVKTTSMHPTMLQLIEDGYELPSVVEAVSIARQRKPWPEFLAIGYLDPIVRNPPKAAVKSWYASESATIAKGKELGLEPRPGEEMDQYRDRIRQAGA